MWRVAPPRSISRRRLAGRLHALPPPRAAYRPPSEFRCNHLRGPTDAMTAQIGKQLRLRGLAIAAPLCLIWHVGWNKIPSGVSREASVRLLRALKSRDQGRV